MTWTRSDVRASAIGALVLTGFGSIWALAGPATAVTTWIPLELSLAGIAAITIALLIPSIALLRASERLPEDDSPERANEEERRRRLFNLVSMGEGVAIALTVAICAMMDNGELIAPLVAIVVGLHFLPLAALFNVPLYYVTGTLMVLISLVTLIFVSSTTELGRLRAWVMIPMAGSALVLWISALGVLLMANGVFSQKNLA